MENKNFEKLGNKERNDFSILLIALTQINSAVREYKEELGETMVEIKEECPEIEKALENHFTNYLTESDKTIKFTKKILEQDGMYEEDDEFVEQFGDVMEKMQNKFSELINTFALNQHKLSKENAGIIQKMICSVLNQG